MIYTNNFTKINKKLHLPHIKQIAKWYTQESVSNGIVMIKDWHKFTGIIIGIK